MHMNQRILLFLLSSLLLFTTARAGNTGKIAGTVKDAQTGEAVIGANVLIEGTSQGAATNLDGYYVILNIPPGKYNLSASGIGYGKKSITGVQVSIDLTSAIDFNLSSTVVDVGEEITVVAQRPLVTKDLTATTAVVTGEQITALPVTEIGQVLSLQAGFTGSGNLRGGRSGEVAYWIDGVPLTDGFNGSQVVEVNKDLVQELQLVSGAFNAEYGQALSGIVNIATKEGGQKFTGGAGFYGGQYATSDKTLFPGLDSFKPTAIRDFEGNLSGPVLGDNLTFFVNGRYIYFDGWLKGFRRFNPWNISYTDEITRQFTLYRDQNGKGDSAAVSMNSSERAYGQGKLTWHISPTIKLNANYIYDWTKSKPYNGFNTGYREYYYDPDGIRNEYNISNTVILQFTHTLSANTFYTIGASFFDKIFKYYLYDLSYAPAPDGSGDLWEVPNAGGPHYVNPRLFSLRDDAYSFATGGTDMGRYKRSTITKLVKADISSQLNEKNLVKIGAELRKHKLFLEDITLQPLLDQTDINLATDSPFIRTRILPVSSNSHDVYDHSPTEFSAYIQDKLEFKDFILNIGLRFDYFDPDGVVLADPTDPEIYNPIKPENRFFDLNGNGIQDPGERDKTVDDRRAYWYKKASKKSQFSPRIGASFPITARGVVHFSYGYFFQIPRFERLYENPDFKLGTDPVNTRVFGNADLKPEQTINGEIGISQQVSDDIKLDLTAYLRDVRDLAGTRADQISVFGGSKQYSQYVNSDFGTTKGIVLTVDKRFGGGFSATLDYTYQIAQGTASDPQAARNAAIAGQLPEVQLTPLDWDQRNTVNVTASYDNRTWGISLISQYHDGSPYTPRRSTDITTLLQNSQEKPSYFNVDLRTFFEIDVTPLKVVLFARVFNLLDTRNEVNVFDDTGRAGFTTDEARILTLNPKQRVNSLDDWFRRPLNYSEPRRIEFGMNLEF
jgi:hypothetical protein